MTRLPPKHREIIRIDEGRRIGKEAGEFGKGAWQMIWEKEWRSAWLRGQGRRIGKEAGELGEM